MQKRDGEAVFTNAGDENWHHLLRADSYGAVLLLLLALLILPAVTPDDRVWRTVIAVVAVAAILGSFRTSRVPTWLFATASVVLAVALIGVVVGREVTDLEAVSYVLIGILLVAAPVSIINRILRHTEVTVRTLLGAIDVYFQLGFAFAFVYQALEHFNAGAFVGDGELNHAALVYFSFVTIATLGYGDIVPVSELARNLAVLETITGQVFLVVVVATVVSMLNRNRLTRQSS